MRLTNLIKLTVFGILGVAACSVAPEMEQEMEERTKDVLELRQKAVVPNEPIPDDLVRVKNDIWLGDTSNIEFEGEAIPTYLEAKDGITLISNRPITLFEIGGMINKITGLSVRYAPELEEDDRTSIGSADSNQPTMESLGQQWTDSTKMVVNYKGPLSGLLEEISNRFGIWWKYEKKEIYFYKYITKTFVLYTLPTTPSVSGDVSGGGEGDGGGSVSASNALNINSVWDEVGTTLENMTTADGKVAMNTGSGTITITDTPTVIKRVAEYITDMNKRMSKQVAISVKVLQVDITNSDGFGFDLMATIAKGNHLKDTSWHQAGTVGGGLLTMGLMKGKLDLTATISALSEEGNTHLVTSGTVTTMNNKAAPLQVTRTENYVKTMEVTTYNNDNSGSAAEPEVEELKTGFMMSVLPRVLDHGRMMMYFNLSLSEKVGMETIDLATGKSVSSSSTDGDSSSDEGSNLKMGYINNPTTESRNFTQELAMKSGETLILAGFEKNSDTLQKQGTGTPDNMLVGGSVKADKTRTVIVVMLTPVVMESPLDPESRMSD